MVKEFSVVVSTDELALLLNKALLIHPHKDILTKVIMGNLDTTSVGLTQLFKALQGIDNELEWKVGMNILVKESMLYSSSIDKDKMKETGMIHQGWLKAHIIKIDIYNSYPITVRYNVIVNNGDIISQTQTASLDYIVKSEEWLEFIPIENNLLF